MKLIIAKNMKHEVILPMNGRFSSSKAKGLLIDYINAEHAKPHCPVKYPTSGWEIEVYTMRRCAFVKSSFFFNDVQLKDI